MNPAIRLQVIHDTRYFYASAVTLSRQLLHLTPRSTPWQRFLSHFVYLDPAPSYEWRRDDLFGNPVREFAIESPHTYLHVRAESVVELLPRGVDGADFCAASPPWETVRDRLAYRGEAAQPDVAWFQFESPAVTLAREFADYASPCFPPGRPLLAAVSALMQQIHDDFEFDPEATTVSTPAHEVLEKRRGVCQDFAHLMLSCLRSLGLAARYVSGYLLTQPPPGWPRLIGADASHAWVSVYCPVAGWVDFDPTNALLPDLEHVTLAWGRDFTDVSPLRGVILGGGEHSLAVAVTVTPVDVVLAENGTCTSVTPNSA